MIIIFIELCRIADSLLWIPKSSRRTSKVLLEDIGILKMESIFLHTNITIIPHSVLYVSLSYYIINPCTSASSNFDDSFS
ncbi:XXYS1_4_G0015160.mRNA.1.CDS.1 [Saccharomyces cerevisiae]|nr:XXYS1_4_G0015160.mRNA.1.CDS.1 [Saccharomyces cerevisiae]